MEIVKLDSFFVIDIGLILISHKELLVLLFNYREGHLATYADAIHIRPLQRNEREEHLATTTQKREGWSSGDHCTEVGGTSGNHSEGEASGDLYTDMVNYVRMMRGLSKKFSSILSLFSMEFYL